MGIISKTVKIKWSKRTKKHYINKGYIFTNYGDEFEVKVEDLSKGSNIKVECECDNCNKKLKPWIYEDYLKRNKKGKTYCNECSLKLYGSEKSRDIRLKNSKSIYDWCVENNRIDILLRWDDELNNYRPEDLSFNTHKKVWLKCLLHPEHESELKNIKSFINGQEGSIKCNQCNSVAQWFIDNNLNINDYWDYEKNTADPWEVSRGCHIKIWIKCQNKDYHGSYETDCTNFCINGNRCPYCRGYKVHSLDSIGQLIIDNYGEEFLWIIWNKKNKKSPFEYSIGSEQKLWWNCPDNKHKPFQRDCYNSVRYEFRCPQCSKERDESMIEEKARLYLEELGYKVLTEHNCTIRPINPKTKQPLPFDNEIVLENGKHLIIEVHGSQHYDKHFYETRYKCNKEEAELLYYKRKLYDRYKRIKCIQMGYNYLELPYWTFNEDNRYKKLIDNKIREILDK